MLIPNLPGSSRVWVFAASRLLTDSEIHDISFLFYEKHGFWAFKVLSFLNLYRNFFYFFLILLWSIICPTDPWFQLIGSIFVVVFFEFCLFLTYLIQNYKKRNPFFVSDEVTAQ